MNATVHATVHANECAPYHVRTGAVHGLTVHLIHVLTRVTQLEEDRIDILTCVTQLEEDPIDMCDTVHHTDSIGLLVAVNGVVKNSYNLFL